MTSQYFKHTDFDNDAKPTPSRVTLPDGRRTQVNSSGVFKVPEEYVEKYEDSEHEKVKEDADEDEDAVEEDTEKTRVEHEDEAEEAYVLTQERLEDMDYEVLRQYASQFDDVDGRQGTEELRQSLEGKHVNAEEEE